MVYHELDAHLIAPKRFVTLSHLHQVEQADYPALLQSTGMTMPDLSKVLRDLEDRGLIEVTKQRRARYGATLVRLTPEGRKAFVNLMSALNRIAGQPAALG